MGRSYTFFTAALLILISCQFPQETESAIVKHTFEVYYFEGSPDGVLKDRILGINGQLPGPTIEAYVGDTVEVTLLNKIHDHQNVTIHWHGLHQRGSIFEDGTSQIAQCPLPYGSFQVYRFNVTQPGTFWYHSHVNSQYTEGLFGAFIVHERKEAYNYDGELTLQLHDWYHRSAHENEVWYLSPASKGEAPYPDSALINGLGRYPCEYAPKQGRTCRVAEQKRPVFTVGQNATYRVRVINTAALTFFNFSIDGHILETIEVDGIDVAKPVSVDVALIAPGQRYSFLVQPVQNLTEDEQRFIIRSVAIKQLLRVSPSNINKFPEAMLETVTGVFRRVLRDGNPKLVEETTEHFSGDAALPPAFYHNGTSESITYLNDMDLSPLDGIPAPEVVDQEFIVESGFFFDEQGIQRGGFNNTSLSLPQSYPLLFSFINKGQLPENIFSLDVQNGSAVQIVINNPRGTHPFHLHGHHFFVVGEGKPNDGRYDPSKHSLTINGVKRDTVIGHGNSWVVIRFVADNPGIWTMHCHMDWHNLGGMALMIVEGADVMQSEKVNPSKEATRICNLHKYSH